eukprot:CAMPEP_0181466402 /NCGR_PEP_ID=MMETSP1110-20121109/36445_1 /TAXON_ID=174948 /ORGANISM="Symbiodinium sp., Strain CCMP421" /LENGTH=65 /DNA_ID=CAMNT_0023591197 /DNA_START=638 /DNA_END=835 /DNA_ORIENTATION=+
MTHMMGSCGSKQAPRNMTMSGCLMDDRMSISWSSSAAISIASVSSGIDPAWRVPALSTASAASLS